VEQGRGSRVDFLMSSPSCCQLLMNPFLKDSSKLDDTSIFIGLKNGQVIMNTLQNIVGLVLYPLSKRKKKKKKISNKSLYPFLFVFVFLHFFHLP
jgi:hypothetical protein